MGKLVIFCLDGATWDIIEPLKSEGELPTFKEIISKGIKANLYSTEPNLTPVAWASFLTGRNPGKHGIYDFFKYEKNIARPVNSKMITRDLLETLNENGKITISVNIPLTYPPKKVNGVIVSGYPVVKPNSNFIYPPDVADALNNYLITRLGHKYCPTSLDFFGSTNTLDSLKEAQYKFVDQTYETSKYLLQNNEWDVFMLYFNATDSIPHSFWKYCDEEHPDYVESTNRNAINECYKRVDDTMGKILSIVPDDAIVFVVSDHGFGPVDRIAYPNNILIELSLLRFKDTLSTKVKFWLFKHGFTLDKLFGIAIKFLRKAIQKSVMIPESRIVGLKNALLLSFDDIDYRRTKAYCRGSGGQLFINEDSPVKRNEIKKSIIGELLKVEDPETGEQVVKEILPKEDIYEGKYMDSAPDLLILPHDRYMMPGQFEFGSNRITSKSNKWSGSHRPKGIFCAKGPGIRNGEPLRDAKITDILPTLLHALGLPIPNDTDGEVLAEVFSKNSSS